MTISPQTRAKIRLLERLLDEANEFISDCPGAYETSRCEVCDNRQWKGWTRSGECRGCGVGS